MNEVKVRILVKHKRGCSAMRLVKAGAWSTPWWFDGTLFWRSARGTTNGRRSKSFRWLRLLCNSTNNDCPAEAIVSGNWVEELAQIELTRRV